jgi:CRP-like cAMP-binding protein
MHLVALPGGLRERALAKLLPQNGLLAALAPAVRERLLPHLALADLPAGHQLGQAGGSFARAYFPVQGIVALVHTGSDGSERIAGLVGREGAVGLPAFMGDAGVRRVVVQSGGYGLALGCEPLLEEWGRGGAFMRLLLRHRDALAVQRAVLAACRHQHALDQQLAALLMMCGERGPGEDVVLALAPTAHLLGAAPAALSVSVDRLRAEGAAAWRRPGWLGVGDAGALRSIACGCASRIAAEYERLLPGDEPPTTMASATPDSPPSHTGGQAPH